MFLFKLMIKLICCNKYVYDFMYELLVVINGKIIFVIFNIYVMYSNCVMLLKIFYLDNVFMIKLLNLKIKFK